MPGTEVVIPSRIVNQIVLFSLLSYLSYQPKPLLNNPMHSIYPF